MTNPPPPFTSTDIAIGWPFLAFSMHGSPNRGHVSGGSYVGSSSIKVIVWRPRPLGFLLNSTLWAACLMLLAVPAVRIARRLRPAWKCPTCGYDRRGLPAGAPCPECGAEANKVTANSKP